MHAPLRGLIPATVTPFDDELRVDMGDLERHLDQTMAADGVRGIVVNAHIGEVLNLSQAECETVIKTALQVRRPGQQVFAAVEGRTVDELVRMGMSASEAGADGLLVLPPLDVRPYRRLFRHVPSVMYFMEALDRAVGLPMIIHQYPDFTGAAYSHDVLDQVIELPNVVAIKAASVAVTRYVEIWDRFHERTTVLIATDAPGMLGMLLHGFHGALIGVAAIRPDMWAQLLQAVEDERLVVARDMFNRHCLPILDAVFQNQEPTRVTSEVAATKAALVALGQIRNAQVRPPAVDVSPDDQAAIVEALVAAQLLDSEHVPV